MTNLQRVKSVARTLLMLDIKGTKFSPAIVKHPFTDSGITGVRGEDGNVQLLRIAEDANDRFQWQTHIRKKLDDAQNVFEIYNMITKPYKLTFLKFIYPHLSKTDMSQLLARAWIESEAPNQDVNVSKAKLVSMFKAADRSSLMDEDDCAKFEGMDEVVTVYRGVTAYNAKNILALSWTTKREVAEWFAHRFGESGTVYAAKIDKAHVYAFFGGRGEEELIVNPAYLMNVHEAEKTIDI